MWISDDWRRLQIQELEDQTLLEMVEEDHAIVMRQAKVYKMDE